MLKSHRQSARILGAFTMTCLLSAGASAAPPGERELKLPEKPHQYANPKLPANFEERWVRALDTTPADNPTTDAGATLGRALFYDTRLSASNNASCGSCHEQKHAFAEPYRVSVGHEGRKGDRNSMSLVNLRWSRTGFFWDERAATLEEAVGLPVRSRIEMAGQGGPALVKAFSADERYVALFKSAFGTGEVSDERIRKALAQFLRSMVSCDSKYDRAASKVATVREEFPDFSEAENRGKAIFLQRCNLCHHIGEGKHVAFFDMFRALNNGIDADANALDGGRGDVTFNPTEVGQFRASSLRNIAVTGPYMHDGRLATLQDVIEHYSCGVKRHPNAGAVGRFGFDQKEKDALVAFLKTLTDETFLNDPKFSDPWVGVGKPRLRDPGEAASIKAGGKRESVTDRLAKGIGLEQGEVIDWLKLLDKNKDGALDKREIEPVIEILVKTRVGVLTAGRAGRGPGGRGGAGPGGDGPAPAAKIEGDLGDFDGDGKVDEAEARAFGSLKRLIELADGGPMRRLVRTDRYLGGFELSPGQADAARKVLDNGRAELDRKMHAADLALLADLRKLSKEQTLAKFQTLVIDRQVASVRRRTAREDDPRPAVEKQVFQFDKNGDGSFSEEELTDLAKALDLLAGGFGQASPEAIGMEQFTTRFAGYDPTGMGSVAIGKLPERLIDLAVEGDSDKDHMLSPKEIEAYIRANAFGHLLDEGIYVGGGFANTLDRHSALVAELDLPEETRKAVEAKFADHEQKIVALKKAAVADLFAKYRDAVGRKAPPSSGRR